MATDTLRERTARQIRADIFGGVFAPGVRLTIDDLSKRYRVSPQPVREALHMIAGERLIWIHPRRGAIVRSFDATFVSNIFDCRAALDRMAVGKCFDYLTSKDVDRMHVLQLQHEKALADRDIRESFLTNRAFHAEIYIIARNEEAMHMMLGGWELKHAMRRFFGMSSSRGAAVIEEHRMLVAALRERNRDLAVATAVTHCELAKRELLVRLQAVPGGDGTGSDEDMIFVPEGADRAPVSKQIAPIPMQAAGAAR